GLALAMSLATALEAGTLWVLLGRRVGGLGGGRVWALAWRAALAALGMAAALYALQAALPGLSPLLMLLLGGGLGLAVYFGAAALLRLDEALAVPRLVLGKFRR
ncbi:MAG: murein biosynthesis integral membrane protein MurJ, partial [Anaerolineae bacterium]|nr:murein biosynthesis integral membrane protein MurJ [Anaerolineae bacterium]